MSTRNLQPYFGHLPSELRSALARVAERSNVSEIGGTAVSASLEWSSDNQAYVLGASEQVVAETCLDFDLLGAPTTITAELSALTYQTGGVAGIYRVRIGGTAGVADGTVVVTLVTTHASYALPPDQIFASPFTNPVGPQSVKLTANASTPGERARIRGFQIIFQ